MCARFTFQPTEEFYKRFMRQQHGQENGLEPPRPPKQYLFLHVLLRHANT
jgi:hypothetical protein